MLGSRSRGALTEPDSISPLLASRGLRARLSRAWRALRDLIEAGSRQQITRTGLVFSLACTLVGFAAFASANNLLFLVLAAMLGALLISGFVSRLTLAGLELEFELPDAVVAGRKLLGRAFVVNAKRWMPSFSVSLSATGDGSLPAPLYFPVIAGGQRAEAPVAMLFPHRGSYKGGRFVLSTGFPFGFAERRVPIHLRREFVVYPPLDPQPGFDALLAEASEGLEARVRGIGSDFHHIRPYQAFESARHVDWKATAHTGGLQVREFARDEDVAVELALDLDVPRERAAWFEWAVACCAFLSWRLNERGARVRLRTANFDFAAPRDGDVHRILRYLAVVERDEGRALPPPVDPRVCRIVLSPPAAGAATPQAPVAGGAPD